MNNLYTKDMIEELIDKNEMVLLYFGSDTCSVCVSMKPKVREILKYYPNIKSAEIDTEKQLELAAHFNAFTIPVILLFIEGKEIIREARHVSMEDINNKISRYYELFYGA
jgi:thioredoxin-like negative regulator of GroEL